MFLLYDKVTLMEVSRLFDEFQAITGLTVNYDKTSVYRIGSIKNTNAKLYTNRAFSWTNEPVVILGITITHELDKLQRLNLAPVFDKMLNVCEIWSRRKITLTGKVVILNGLVSSLLIHKLTVLPLLKPHYVEEYIRIIKNFLWEGKKSKMSLETLYNPKKWGGLALINVVNKDRALKAQWVTKCNLHLEIQCSGQFG